MLCLNGNQWRRCFGKLSCRNSLLLNNLIDSGWITSTDICFVVWCLFGYIICLYIHCRLFLIIQTGLLISPPTSGREYLERKATCRGWWRWLALNSDLDQAIEAFV